jgi:regulator of telomere elongation helicase 1
MLNECVKIWQSLEIYQKINEIKNIFYEPSNPNEFAKIIIDYYNNIKNKKGGILMGVCRGRISEGLNFSDDAARCVIIIGIPYA